MKFFFCLFWSLMNWTLWFNKKKEKKLCNSNNNRIKCSVNVRLKPACDIFIPFIFCLCCSQPHKIDNKKQNCCYLFTANVHHCCLSFLFLCTFLSQTHKVNLDTMNKQKSNRQYSELMQQIHTQHTRRKKRVDHPYAMQSTMFHVCTGHASICFQMPWIWCIGGHLYSSYQPNKKN